jgi:aminoglycoside/choline kinase family phosphotransferase
VIGKFPSDDPTSRSTGADQGGYRKEVEFYRRIAPTVDLRTPHIYAAHLDDDTGDFVLLMEDLTESVQGDQLTGCSVDEAALAMEQAARLHAPRWGDPKLADFDFLGGDHAAIAAGLQQIYHALWPGFEARYADRLDPEVMALAERFRDGVGAWSHALATPDTVTHGDFRLDNLLFGRSPTAPPLVVVDFQTAGHGYGAGDVSYFLGGSLPLVLRRAEEERLVRVWWEALVAGGVAGYGWDACWHDYRHRTYGGVVMAVVASQVVVQTDRGDDMFIAMAEGAGRHALDLEAEKLLG